MRSWDSESVCQWVSQSVSQSVIQSVSQSVSQSFSQSVSQPVESQVPWFYHIKCNQWWHSNILARLSEPVIGCLVPGLQSLSRISSLSHKSWFSTQSSSSKHCLLNTASLFPHVYNICQIYEDRHLFDHILQWKRFPCALSNILSAFVFIKHK